MRQDITVISFSQKKKGAPWRISFFLNGASMSAGLGKNETTMGSRLKNRLAELEKDIINYPFEISYSHIKDVKQRNATANVIGRDVSYIECGVGLYKNFHRGKKKQDLSFLENPFSSDVVGMLQEAPEEGTVFSTMNYANEDLGDAGVNENYIVIGKPHFGHGTDGDTVTIVPEYIGPEAAKQGVTKTKYEVRYVGIQTPETDKTGTSLVEYANQRNAAYAQYFNVTVADAYEIADEAAVQNRKYLGDSNPDEMWPLGAEDQRVGEYYILVHLDRTTDGTLTSTHGRLVGVLYQTNMKTSTEVLNALKAGGAAFRNINKSLLVDKSAKFPPAPLAYMEYDSAYGYAAASTNTVLNPVFWAKELKLKIFDPGTNDNPTGVSPSSSGMKDVETAPQDDDSDITGDVLNSIPVQYSEDYVSNTLDFVKPNDDRFDSIFAYKDEVQYQLDSRVRIGDVLLTIPPLSISVDKASTIEKVKTLRTRSSMMSKTGQTTTTLTMELYFHDLENINGIEHKTGNHTFYVDGLRSLIAQFSKCPFVPIDNPYVNNVLGIHEVALLDLSVQTVPGFPHSISATITLAKFDLQAYMPNTAFLGEAINYPLMRWFYQESMRDRGTGRVFYQPINLSDGGLTNEFTFQIANRARLEARMNAFKTINAMDTPEKLREQAKAGTNELGVVLGDAERASDLIDRYNKYIKLKDDMKSYSLIESGLDIGMIKDTYMKKYTLNEEGYENNVAEGQTRYEQLYNSSVSTKKSEIFFWETPTFYEYRIGDKPTTTVSDGYGTYYSGKSEWPNVPKKLTDSDSLDWFAGYAQIGLGAAVSTGYLPDEWKAGKKIDGLTGYYVPLTGEGIAKLKKIAGQKDDVEKTLDSYEEDYDKLQAVINETENDLPMDDYPVTGLIPTSLTVMYGNQFSTLPVLESDSPTLQYMGSQDPYVQVTFEVNDQGLMELNKLAETIDEYSRIYRQGISVGFLGITNPLVQLFGITTVMIESARFQTVPNFPGRNQVQMTLVGFNKTQRRAEQLAGFNGVLPNTKLKDIENNKQQQTTDAIAEMRLRKMEVYPDLELPTYDELNKAIGDLGLNTTYTNRTGALYVDPDFYVATPWTFRDALSKDYMGDHALYLKDSAGVQVKTSPNSDRLIDADTDNWNILSSLSEGAARVESLFSWGDASNTASDTNGDGSKEPVTYASPEISDYMTKADDKGVRPYQATPTYEEWSNWTKGSKDSYDKWKDNPNPSEKEVFDYMYNEFSYWFTGKYALYGKDFVKKKKLSTEDERVSYASSSYFYAVVYEHIKDGLSKKQLSKLKERSTVSSGGAKASFAPPKVKKDKVSDNDWASSAYIMPFERVFGMMKALFHFSSKWKQFNSKKVPVIDAAYNSCGVSGVPLADVAKTVDEAKRILWDWQYNVKLGIQKLVQCYKEAFDADKVEAIEFKARPWEVMVYYYANGKMPESTNGIDQIGQDGVTNSVIDIFSKFYTKEGRWGSPSAAINSDIYCSYLGLSKKEVALVKGTAKIDTYIDVLVDDLAYRWTPVGDFFDDGHTKYTGKYKKDWEKYKKDHADDDHFGPFQLTDYRHAGVTKLILKNHFSLAQVKSIFNKRIVELKNKEDWRDKHPILGGLAELWEKFLDVTNLGGNETDDGEQIIDDVGTYGQAIDNLVNNRLVSDDDPKQLYRDMYQDLIKYDHRGRLLRAFPAFQMLIIDEGKWMGRFKFWDNMYGFNAIESIDVYRSRKIAADTAVIRMTNMYSNLTTMRVNLNYQDRKSDVWSNLIMEKPTQELVDTRNELLNQMMLETGARVHLRMGYGADAAAMPIVFNGTITELDSQDVVEIVCQGDGVELGNMISGDPDDDNNGFFQVTEPRDLICELLTSKGSWFNDVVNNLSGGRFMRDNPLGIMHFGIPGATAPAGTLSWVNTNYGEAAQNIYSSNGTPTFSQWTHPDGTSRNLVTGSFWNNIMSTNITRWFQPGDEDNIIVKFYNNTTWDVIQTLAYCSMDYIAAVHPFETRSTLFFGKPYWKLAHAYSSTYNWDEAANDGDGGYVRKINVEHRKPYMQFRYYDSTQDIIKNSIKASEEGVFTNVIVSYDTEYTPILSADYDIRYDKQKTQVVQAEIVARFPGVDYWTSEQQARTYGMSALRDSLKDMYKGSLLVIGDPSVKPHDAMYLSDYTSTMNGTTLVKAVTHHMSIETGFVTSVEPDAYVVNDDLAMLSFASWLTSACTSTVALVQGLLAARRAKKLLQQSKTVGKLINSGKSTFEKLEQGTVKRMLDMLDANGEPEFKTYREAFEELYKLDRNASKTAKLAAQTKLEDAAKGLRDYVDKQKQAYKDTKKFSNFWKGEKQAKESFAKARLLARQTKAIGSALKLGAASKGALLRTAFQVAKGGFAMTGVGFIIEIGATIATESIFEAYSRYKEALQCVLMLPLQYRGREMTSGINGHQGMVVGDQPGKLDRLVSAVYGADESDKDQDYINWVFETMNFLSGSEKQYGVSQQQLTNNPTTK